MTLTQRITTWSFTGLTRLAWGTGETGRTLGGTGKKPENWVDGTAAYRGNDLLDVLAPLTKRRNGAEEA
jgi:hypothetical protein